MSGASPGERSGDASRGPDRLAGSAGGALPGRAGSRAAWGLCAALTTFAIVVACIGARTEAPILSYDDIFRTRFAHDWSRQPFFFTERLVWLPFPLMVTGLAMRLTAEAFWTALAVDLAATAVAIWYVHRLTDRLFGPLAAWIAASLFGLTPWVVFLGLSRYSEPVLLATVAVGVHHWVRWRETTGSRDIVCAAVALGAAVLTRYEAWPLGLALPAHAAAVLLGERSGARSGARLGAWLWSLLPVALMGVWAWRNLLDYGTPIYGGAYGFLPEGAPAGALRGSWLVAQHLWQLSPLLALLGVLGAWVERRRASLLGGVAVLAAIVPWYTVSLLRVDVALQVRLMVLPLMLIAPFAGGLLARGARRWRFATAVAASLVAGQFILDLRLEHPGTPPPMALLALRLERGGIMDRFDSVYVQSTHPVGYPDEVRVATNFRRRVHVFPPDPSSAPWKETAAGAVLVLNDGKIRPGGAFVVSRLQEMTAWGLCNRPEGEGLAADWLSVSAPAVMKPRELGTVRVTLRNAGARPWRDTACGVFLSARWLGESGRVGEGESRRPLPRVVAPGETVAAEVSVEAPTEAGEYTLALGLAADGPATRAKTAADDVRLDVRVTAP